MAAVRVGPPSPGAAVRDWLRGLLDPVPLAEYEVLDPAFAPDLLGPTPAAEAVIIGDSRRTPAGPSDREVWILAVLARRARRIFEFGTATGRTTYLLARNAPEDAHVTTLALPPDRHADYRAASGDRAADRRHALRESRWSTFRYQGTAVEHKVTQVLEDSKAWDAGSVDGPMDLVFVDGSHAYSYVASDSGKALGMLAPDGVVLWHDYRRAAGVTRYVRELARRRTIVRLRGTSLAAHRPSWDA